jgi:hypothetical protein
MTASAVAIETPRPVKLQINTKGSWANLVDFDCAHETRVLSAAAELFCHDDRIKLRVVEPGGVNPPLMHWSTATGWRKWGDHGRQA